MFPADSSAFQGAQPFPHLVVERFLDPDLCERLAGEFPAFDSSQAVNERGETGLKAVQPDLPSLGPAFAEFDRMLQAPEFLLALSAATGIQGLLYDSEYIGGGTHENLSGQDLDTHVDFNFHPRRKWHRRLNLIVFLNREWREEWGGALELLRDPHAASAGDQAIAPEWNRCVVFETSERSWHGFRRIAAPDGVSRRSIAVYFYTEERPVEEVAPSHGTVYYQRPLAERFRAGYTLTEEDEVELQQAVERRDQQIRFLYERELGLSREYHRIVEARWYRSVRWLAGPLRKLVRW